MKYILLITVTMLSGIFAQFENPETGWTYAQSTTQGFAQLENITVDGEAVVGDGTGAQDESDCLGSGLCDVVGAFIDRNDGEGEICVGWQYANSEGWTTISLNGNDGLIEGTELYMNAGEVAYFKIWDATYSSVLEISLSEPIAGWENFGFLQVTGTSTACNGGDTIDDCGVCSGSFSGHDANSDIDCAGECFGNSEIDCTGECGGSEIIDECGICGGGNLDMDCAGVCFGLSVNTWCDESCGETGPVDDGCDVCGGDNSSCSGCTNSDADNYNAENLFDDDSCEYTISPATNLAASPGPERVFLVWDAPLDNFTESSVGYKYHIYQDGSFIRETLSLSYTIIDLEITEYCFTILAIHNEYGESDSYSNESCATPEEVVGPTWRLQLVAEIDVYDQFENTGNPDWLIEDRYNFIGAAPDATWGYDHVHDILEPVTPPGLGHISLFFDHPEWTDDDWNAHYTEDIVKDDDAFFSTNLTQWNGRIESDVPGATTITFHVETGQIPLNYQMYIELDGDFFSISHDSPTTIGFYMGGSGQQDFSVYIGNIPPQAPDALTATHDKKSISLDWTEDGDGLHDIGNRYPAVSYNVYRDDEPADIGGNECLYDSNGTIVSSIYDECLNDEDCSLSSGCAPGNGPGGCGGLLTGTYGQSNSDYHDEADIYDAYPGEGLLQESTYTYTVTGSNQAGESSYGHTIRMSGGAEEFFAGRDSRITDTTDSNANPEVVLANVESADGTNLGEGHYEIPHNYSPDENRISISDDGSASNDSDYPYMIHRFSWSQIGGIDDLQDISGTDTDEVTFTVGNPHNNGAKSYTWNLHVESDHPVKTSGECGEWTSELHTHSDDAEIAVTIEEEPNSDPVASSALGLIRAGDENSVVTSDDYDISDFNDYDGNPGDPDNDIDASGDQVWYEPHDNMGAANPADLWFSADKSSDPDTECSGSDEEGCDHQTYEWFATSATDIGFDYEDLNGDGQYNYGEPFSLLGNEALIYEDIDLGDYYAAGGASVSLNTADDLVTCDACIAGEYGTNIDAETGLSLLNGINGAFGYNGRDAHISMYGGGDDSVIILTMVVTDVYGDSDQISLIATVLPERNQGPTANPHRVQPNWYIAYDDDNREVFVDAACDNLGAEDLDNDDLIYDWSYSGDDATTDLGEFDSSYDHDDGGSILDATADLGLGNHIFTFRVTDSYGAYDEASTEFAILNEPGAPAGNIDLVHTDLKYVTIQVSENTLPDYDIDCHGEVYNGADNNTARLDLLRGEDVIKSWDDTDDIDSGNLEWIDKHLESETEYNYTLKTYNSDLDDQEDDIAATDAVTTTHDRPLIHVDTPNGAEIRSIGDNFSVDFSTTQHQYISRIEVYYLRDGSEEEAGVNNAGESIYSDTGVNVDGVASGDNTNHFEISDNDDGYIEEINYNAKVLVRVFDVGDYDGGNVEYHDDISDFPFTMADHEINKDYLAGWHLVGPPVIPAYEDTLLYNNFSSLGTWGQDWVVFDVNGAYDGLYLTPTQGYYLALADNSTLQQIGDPITTDPDGNNEYDNIHRADISLDKGWNLISNPLVNKVSKENLKVNYDPVDDGGSDLDFEDAVDAGWIAPSIYGWFQDSYEHIDRLVPFGGYFVNTSRDLTLKVRPHLFEDGNLTRKLQVAETSIIELKARDISGEGHADFITVGLLENADDGFVYGEDEYDLPRQAYTSMGGEYIDMKIGSDLMKDMKSTEYEDFQVWNISIATEKVDNDIEISWSDISGFDDGVYIVINGEAIDLHQESYIELSTITDEFAIVVGNVDAYLNPVPDKFGLGAAYPNPFNPTTNLNLAMNEDDFVNMSVYNIRGQIVEVLVDRNMRAGYHNITWNADGISSGMYFVRVDTGSNTAIQKVMLLK